MNKKGILIKLDSLEAIIMTKDFKYFKIKSKPYMLLGQEYEFSSKDIILPKKVNSFYIAFAASIAASLLFIFSIYTFFLKNPVVAYLDIEINPRIELAINEKNQVIDIESENSDALKLLNDVDIRGKSLTDSIRIIIQKSMSKGYIKSDVLNYILVAASLKSDKLGQSILDNALKDCVYGIKQAEIKNIDTRFIKVDTEFREQAIANHISMGRYKLYLDSKNNGSKITLEDAKIKPLREVIEEISNNNYNKTTSSSTDNLINPTITNTLSISSPHMKTPQSNTMPTPTPYNKTPYTNTAPHPHVTSYIGKTPHYYLTPKPFELKTPQQPTPLKTKKNKYDVNNDGLVDSKDSEHVKKAMDSNVYYEEYDMNGDGRVDKLDYYELLNTLPTIPVIVTPKPNAGIYDLNSDGSVNKFDLEIILKYIKAQVYEKAYDVNQDGIIDDADYRLVEKNQGGSTVQSKCDLNFDGNLDGRDIDIMNKAINEKSYDKNCDLNGDGVVNHSDYVILQENVM